MPEVASGHLRSRARSSPTRRRRRHLLTVCSTGSEPDSCWLGVSQPLGFEAVRFRDIGRGHFYGPCPVFQNLRDWPFVSSRCPGAAPASALASHALDASIFVKPPAASGAPLCCSRVPAPETPCAFEGIHGCLVPLRSGVEGTLQAPRLREERGPAAGSVNSSRSSTGGPGSSLGGTNPAVHPEHPLWLLRLRPSPLNASRLRAL